MYYCDNQFYFFRILKWGQCASFIIGCSTMINITMAHCFWCPCSCLEETFARMLHLTAKIQCFFFQKRCTQWIQTKNIKHNGTFTSVLQMAIFSIIPRLTTLKSFFWHISIITTKWCLNLFWQSVIIAETLPVVETTWSENIP